jgi:hypothetical protein
MGTWKTSTLSWKKRSGRTPEVDFAVSQAIAHIDALILWVRERDMAFLERNVYVEVRKLEEAEELDA